MRTKLIALTTLAFGFPLAACDRNPAPRSARNAVAEDPVVQGIKQIESGVRLAAANKRIDELERRVGALEDTPEKLDLALLTQRMTALEVQRIGVLPEAPPQGRSVDRRGQAITPPRGSGKVSRLPDKAPRLSLPNLEKRSRMATAAEAKAFASKPQN